MLLPSVMMNYLHKKILYQNFPKIKRQSENTILLRNTDLSLCLSPISLKTNAMLVAAFFFVDNTASAFAFFTAITSFFFCGGTGDTDANASADPLVSTPESLDHGPTETATQNNGDGDGRAHGHSTDTRHGLHVECRIPPSRGVGGDNTRRRGPHAVGCGGGGNGCAAVGSTAVSTPGATAGNFVGSDQGPDFEATVATKLIPFDAVLPAFLSSTVSVSASLLHDTSTRVSKLKNLSEILDMLDEVVVKYKLCDQATKERPILHQRRVEGPDGSGCSYITIDWGHIKGFTRALGPDAPGCR